MWLNSPEFSMQYVTVFSSNEWAWLLCIFYSPDKMLLFNDQTNFLITRKLPFFTFIKDHAKHACPNETHFKALNCLLYNVIKLRSQKLGLF